MLHVSDRDPCVRHLHSSLVRTKLTPSWGICNFLGVGGGEMIALEIEGAINVAKKKKFMKAIYLDQCRRYFVYIQN